MHNEVWGCAEILPAYTSGLQRIFFHLSAILKLWTYTLLEKTTRQIIATENVYSITRNTLHLGW